jgi:hypothetical protein
MRALAVVALLSLTSLGCAGREGGRDDGPLTTQPIPPERGDREQVLRALGEELHGALREGHLDALLLDDTALDEILRPRAATRARASRAVGRRDPAAAADLALFRDTTFEKLCLQGARTEARDDAVGLRHPGWVFDRALVAGRRADGRRIGAWLEGSFVYTTRGFYAIGLRRVEAPRWEHSDLELAPCDMEANQR